MATPPPMPTVTVTISLDEQWMVRYLDVNVDLQAVLDYKAERDVETPYPYRYTLDVVSITDVPPRSWHRPTRSTRRRPPPRPLPRWCRDGVHEEEEEEEPRWLEVHSFRHGRRRADHRRPPRQQDRARSANRRKPRGSSPGTHRADAAFAFAAARLRITIGSIYNDQGSTIDLTTTRDVSLDRESATVSSDISIERTAAEVSPGVSAIPFHALNAQYSVILTKLYRFESPDGRWHIVDAVGCRALLLRDRAR